MKKLIFDIDNTLIYWKDEYICALEETLKEYNIDIDAKKINDIVDNLENMFSILSKEKLLECINAKCNLNLNINFINSLFERQKKLAPHDEKLLDIIKYLNNKYELIIYTNYFHEVQEGRLGAAGILNYFSKIYGGDDIPVKPNKEGFDIIIGNDNKEDFIMIGDSIRCDITGAKNAGIKAILYDYKNIHNDSTDYIRINNLDELKEIL